MDSRTSPASTANPAASASGPATEAWVMAEGSSMSGLDAAQRFGQREEARAAGYGARRHSPPWSVKDTMPPSLAIWRRASSYWGGSPRPVKTLDCRMVFQELGHSPAHCRSGRASEYQKGLDPRNVQETIHRPRHRPQRPSART